MYTLITIVFLISLAQVTIIDQYKSSQLTIKQFNMIKKNNLYLVKLLDDVNQENRIDIKDFREEGDLVSQNDIANLTKNYFITFQR